MKTILSANDYAVTVELGRIVAVDLFIGNSDRFNYAGKVHNYGNIM